MYLENWWKSACLVGFVLMFCVSTTSAQANQEQGDQSALVSSAAFNFGDGFEFNEANINTNTQRYRVNIRDCRELVADNIQMTADWAFEESFSVGDDREYALKLFAGEDNCERRNLSEDTGESACLLRQEARALSGSVQSNRLQHPIRARTMLDIVDPENCSGSPRSRELILVFQQSDGVGGIRVETDRLRVTFALTRPAAPSGLSAVAGEGSIRVSWDEAEGEEDVDYVVYYSTEEFDLSQDPNFFTGDVRTRAATGGSTTLTSGVTVGNEYYIAVVTRDQARNFSEFSEQITVTTVPVADFWETYREAGGQETGGYCAHVPARGGLPLMMVLIGGLWMMRRASTVEVRHA